MSTTATYNVASESLHHFLDRKVKEYNQPSFVSDDPIGIPHSFCKKQDIEIAGFFTAVFSWGNRTTIIRKSRELMRLMDNSPHQFILHHSEQDLRKLLSFKHRTFNPTDLLYFIEFLHYHYGRFESLEDAFLLGESRAPRGPQRSPDPGKPRSSPDPGKPRNSPDPKWEARAALAAFHHYFFSLDDVPPRTRKHIATPDRNSSCKRLNMFLRWMVRDDGNGVDFGCWNRIPVSRLICPLDLHVARVARRFGLLTRKPTDWTAAVELTDRLAQLDPDDPAKYDFALFSLGALEMF